MTSGHVRRPKCVRRAVRWAPMTRRLVRLAIVVLLVGVGNLDARLVAWGNDGHQIVCAIAYKLLSVSDQQEVDRLVRLYRTPDNGRFQFFTKACTFPDLARSQARSHDEAVAQRWHHFAQFNNWHFLNLPRSERVVDAHACGGDCVLHGIEQHLNRLRNHALPDKDRAEALIFLGHWVGDVHQPLHVSYKDDLGGNSITPITGFYAPLEHLHGVWDSGIVGKTHANGDWWTFSGELRSRITPALQQEWSAVAMTQWAQESYDVTTKPETQYCRWTATQCRSIPGGRHLDASYQTMFGDVAELRLQQAGVRLATLIRDSLHP